MSFAGGAALEGVGATRAARAAQMAIRPFTPQRYARRHGHARGLLLLHDLEADTRRHAVVAGRVGGGGGELVGTRLELSAFQAAAERDAVRAGGRVAREAAEGHHARA